MVTWQAMADRWVVMFVDEKITAALFKLALLAAGCLLIAANEQGPIIDKMDTEYHALRYQVEADNGNQELDKIQCESLKTGVADCRLAKYKGESLDTYVDTFLTVFGTLKLVFLGVLFSALISFFGRPFVELQDAERAQKEQQESGSD